LAPALRQIRTEPYTAPSYPRPFKRLAIESVALDFRLSGKNLYCYLILLQYTAAPYYRRIIDRIESAVRVSAGVKDK
jgi:hypothetical protein